MDNDSSTACCLHAAERTSAYRSIEFTCQIEIESSVSATRSERDVEVTRSCFASSEGGSVEDLYDTAPGIARRTLRAKSTKKDVHDWGPCDIGVPSDYHY